MSLQSAEAIILASIIESNGAVELPPCLSGLLDNAPESFDDARHGQIAVAVRELKLDARPVHPVSVAERLKFTDSTVYMMQLMGNAMTLEVAEEEAEPIWDAFFVRKTKSVLSEATDAVSRNPAHAEGVVDGVCYTLEDLKSQKKGARPPAAKVLAKRQFNPNIIPPPIRPVFKLDDRVIATPCNLSSITSAVKTGKSSAIGAMIASAFPHPDNADMLGFESANPKNLGIVHIDSEQSPDDHWYCVNRMVRRAGLKLPPPWFHSYCLTGLGFKAILDCFVLALEMSAQQHGGLLAACLDGIADLVSDVNDPAECNALIAQLHGLSIKYDCHINGVIHFNPGTEKSRGHLGSQFERKAETNLRLDKTNEITTIWSDKQRRAPIPKGSGPCFCWSDEHQMHVSCTQSIANNKKGGRTNKVANIACMNLHEFLAGCIPSGEGRNQISKRLESWLLTSAHMDVSETTCREAVAACVANQKLHKDPGSGRYFKGPEA
jgi:hypothetical protein